MRNKKYPEDEYYAIMFNYFLSVYDISIELRDALRARCNVGEFKPKEIVLQEGEICRHCYFLMSGLLRAYALKDGNDVTVWVMTAGDVAIGVSSFYQQKPSEEYIVALEKTIYIRISYDDLEWIYENFIEFNVMGRKLTEKYHQLFNKRLCTMADSREERYRKFLDEYPHLVNRVPSKHIATLLGMTPTYLSKIKANLRISCYFVTFFVLV